MLLNIKKNNPLKYWMGFLFLAGILWILQGCTTRESGCLNPDASNFDLDADRGCDDCCKFPKVSLVLKNQWDSMAFVTTDTFYDIHHAPFQIFDLKYFLSGWEWKDTGGERFSIDTTEALCGTEFIQFIPDMIIADAENFLFPIGEFKLAPVIDTLKFQLGLSRDFECLEDADPDTPASLTALSPLYNPEEEMLATIRLIVNVHMPDTLLDTLFIRVNKPFSIPYAYTFRRGSDTPFSITVNYAPWFSQVDITDLNSFPASITQGLEGTFFRTP